MSAVGRPVGREYSAAELEKQFKDVDLSLSEAVDLTNQAVQNVFNSQTTFQRFISGGCQPEVTDSRVKDEMLRLALERSGIS